LKYPFKNLVLAGGGIWGVCYAGVAAVLEKKGIYSQIQRTAGVSAGAIYATLMSVGYSADDMMNIVKTAPFHTFEDKPNLFRVFTKYGLFKGDAFLSWMGDMIAQSPAGQGNAGLTFKELQDRTGREVYVFATDLNTQTYKELSARTVPDWKIAEGVRASMSVPLIFSGWRFPDAADHQNIYVDGGMMDNYPLNFFDEPPFVSEGTLTNPETLGFLFMAPRRNAQRPDDGLKFGDMHTYLKSLAESILIGVMLSLQVPGNQERTVLTDAHATGISALDFKVKPEQIDQLIEAGRASITDYLKTYQAPSSK
jgi:NTE family protein